MDIPTRATPGPGPSISIPHPRDTHTHANNPPTNLTDTIYTILPSRALDLSSADIRASSLPTKRYHDSKTSSSSKRKGSTDFIWRACKGGKRNRLEQKLDLKMELHQSTCLNLNAADEVDSDLWILPDFEEWEVDESAAEQKSLRSDGEWAPLVERAVHSNRERLRRRLEGDGWDFVGGKYGEDGGVLDDEESSAGSEESVDEEFDVVVLPEVEVS